MHIRRPCGFRLDFVLWDFVSSWDLAAFWPRVCNYVSTYMAYRRIGSFCAGSRFVVSCQRKRAGDEIMLVAGLQKKVPKS